MYSPIDSPRHPPAYNLAQCYVTHSLAHLAHRTRWHLIESITTVSIPDPLHSSIRLLIHSHTYRVIYLFVYLSTHLLDQQYRTEDSQEAPGNFLLKSIPSRARNLLT
eukprot:GHVU01061736.1.p2 GENE.GHVU01061736.1~~GHVU01061736.1.p2  ORF type:complete len:107 (-),score=0.81 GHVU01061736.1:23-343(-)